jgi:malonyl-CoA/methylmalonyl-CoA synthetase
VVTEPSRSRLTKGPPDRRTVAAWAAHAGADVDPAELLAKLGAGSLPAAFQESAREAGDRPALTVDGESLTYRELDDAVARLAAWLAGRGVGAGDRVLLCGPNSVPFAVAYLAVLRAGAVATPASAALTEPELRHLIADSGAVAAFAGGEALERLRRLTETEGAPRLTVSLDGDGPGPTVADGIEHPELLPVRQLDPKRPAMLAYTSGTTGRPKGALLRHANLLASLRGIMLAWRFGPEDVLVHSLPLTHQHGLSGLQATLLTGARAVIHGAFDPARLCGEVSGQRATVLFAVPTVYERLLSWQGIASADLSSLRLATSGSAPMSPSLFERVQRLLGKPPLERYGTTETGLDISNPYDGPRRPGRVGLPLPGVEIAVVDADGHELADGADGELLLRGPQVFGGYWPGGREAPDSFRPGGWFRTGDLARIDPEDGFVSITGRLKEVIISGGLNVYPREVESALEEHRAVQRAAVVGLPSARWGEEVVAFVVPREGEEVDPGEVGAHARELLAPYKCPKAVYVTAELPLNALGKLQRPRLVELGERLRREEEP